MKLCHFLTVGIALLGASLGSIPSAFAFGYRTCSGVFSTWPITLNGNVTLFRDTCSAPNGSAAEIALTQTRSNWNAVNSALSSRISLSTYNDGCIITDGNGRNEYALVSRASISGFNGLTTQHWDTCAFSAAHYTEGDIKIANDHVMTNEDESFWNWSNAGQGQVVLAHEYGHFLGLLHSEGFDIMRAVTPYPLIGGSDFHGAPFMDDAAGSRFLYSSSSITDVFVSAQKFSGGAIQATDVPGTVNRCRNGTISVTYTVGNHGTVNVTNTGFRIYLTQSPGSPGGGTNLFNGTATVNANGSFTETRTLTIPSNQPLGLYWIQWQIDTGSTTSETRENNNFVHSAMTVNVNC
jgi:hypothetical protein